MKSLLWLAKVLVLPVFAGAMVVWWSASSVAHIGPEGMAWWACVLLLGGLALAAVLPRFAVVSLYGAFVLQLVRPETRFDQSDWLPYAAVFLVAIVLAARTADARRRGALLVMLPLGVLIGLFTNVPNLGPVRWANIGSDEFTPAYSGAFGLVNGKSWAPLTTSAGWELVIGLLVWSAGAVVLVGAGWSIGSSFRSRRLQRQAQAETASARAALSDSEYRLQVSVERDRIAQDVHDITAHSLSVIMAQADGAAAHATEPMTHMALSTIATSARQALTELRGLLEHLDQQTDGDTAHSATEVTDLVETVRAAGAEVDLLESGSAAPLSQAAGLAAFRIVQEALTNALRHGSGRAPIRVHLDWQPDGVAITVSSSIDPADAADASTAGRGLVGMQQRARLAGGWLTTGVDSDTGSFLVTGYLPAQHAVIA